MLAVSRSGMWTLAPMLALGLASAHSSSATPEARSRAEVLAPPEGEFHACAEHRPSWFSQWRCVVPGVDGVCANRNEFVCVRAPCPQPWYDRCSAYTACSDERVIGYVVGACVEAEGGASMLPRRSR